MNDYQNKKRYSFLNMKHAISSTGSSFVGVSVEGLACRVSGIKQANGKHVFSFSIPIYNRGAYIEKMCGLHPTENRDGAVWANVSFWQDSSAETGLVTRLNHLFQKNRDKNLVLLITGAIKVMKAVGNDGREYVNTKITGDDFLLIRTIGKQSSQTAWSQQSQQTPQGQWPQQSQRQEVPQGQQVVPQVKQSQQDQWISLQSQCPDKIPSGLNGNFYEIEDDEDLPF